MSIILIHLSVLYPWVVSCLPDIYYQQFLMKINYLFRASGFFRIRMTESPRRNIFEMNLSLFTGLDFFFPLPARGCSVHISLTFSKTMLQCLSNALTLPSSFLLFLQLMRTWVLCLTESVRMDRGPVAKLSSSSCCLGSVLASAMLRDVSKDGLRKRREGRLKCAKVL